MNDLATSLFRFVVTGVGLGGLSFACQWGLIAQGLAAWQATLLLYPAFVVLSFLVNRAWSFGNRTRARGQFLRFILMHAVIYVATSGVVWFLEGQGLDKPLASLAGIAFAAASAFIASHLWIFRARETEQ